MISIDDAAGQDALVDAAERALGPRYLDVIAWLRDQNQLDDIAHMIAIGHTSTAVQMIEEAAMRYAAAVHQEFVQSAIKVADWIDDKTGIPISFDAANERAAAWATQNQTMLVQTWASEQRSVINSVISRGVRAGDNPLVIAEDVRGSIGLTPQLEDWVASYERQLRDRDYSTALDRALSHGHSDRVVAAAQDAQRAMTDAQIETAVDRYRENALTLRAQTIARTDAMRAVHEGADEQIQQAIDRDDIPKSAVIFTWVAGPATKDARPDHQALDGTQIAYGESFHTAHGATLRYPGDPDAPADETINCRCRRTTRLRFSKIIEFRKARGLWLPAVLHLV